MNGAHLHLLVNHLPVFGFAIALVLLTTTMLRHGDRGMFLASVLVLVIAGGGALAAQFTGEPAEEVVENLQDVPKDLIETHEEVALVATILAGVTALMALIFFGVTMRRGGPITTVPVAILLVASLVTCGAMAWTGATGGKIRHSEVRGTVVSNPASNN